MKTAAEEQRTYNNAGTAYVATRPGYAYSEDEDYGNLTSTTDFNWSGTSWAPYRSNVTEYFPKVEYDSEAIAFTTYLAGLPARHRLKDGAGNDLTEDLNLYDHENEYATPPATGELTAVRQWVSEALYSQTSYEHDDWGNIEEVTTYDEYGGINPAPITGARTTWTVYDEIFHAYPVTITNDLEQTTTIATGRPLTGAAGL